LTGPSLDRRSPEVSHNEHVRRVTDSGGRWSWQRCPVVPCLQPLAQRHPGTQVIPPGGRTAGSVEKPEEDRSHCKISDV